MSHAPTVTGQHYAVAEQPAGVAPPPVLACFQSPSAAAPASRGAL